MRTFFRDHWKAIVVIVVLILLAMFTVTPGAAAPTPSLGERLRAHVEAISSSEHNTAHPKALEQAARYIEATLKDDGYTIRRQAYQAGGQTVRNIEVSIANVAPHARPARIFIVGAHCGESVGTPDASAPGAPSANDNGSGSGSGAAAVLELARLLKGMRPSQGTEIKFVFFVNEAQPWLAGRYPDAGRPDAGRPDAGNFIAFAGTLASSRVVQQALAAFQNASDFPARGMAAPDYGQGVTLSGHAVYQRFDYPAIMVTDTAFGRYPYYEATNDRAEDTPDDLDYESVARVVSGLARTIEALAGAQQE